MCGCIIQDFNFSNLIFLKIGIGYKETERKPEAETEIKLEQGKLSGLPRHSS